MLFRFSDNTSFMRGFALAHASPFSKAALSGDHIYKVVANIQSRTATKCSICQRHIPSPLPRMMYLRVEEGSRWPDVMQATSAPYNVLLSERVIDHLHAAGIHSFEVYPTVIEEKQNKKLRETTSPNYFLLRPTSTVDLDIQLTNFYVPVHTQCPECHRIIFDMPPPISMPNRWVPDRYVPNMKTWDGSDILTFRNYGQELLCTERIILLARENRWTNCRFEPIDASRKDSLYWKGVDYLGKKWPPDEWYPPTATDDKSVDHWLAAYRSDNADLRRKAERALRELAAQAVPGLAAMLHDVEWMLRYRAAMLLLWLHMQQRVVLPDEVRKLSAACLDEIAHGNEEGYSIEAAKGLKRGLDAGVFALSDEVRERLVAKLRPFGEA